MKVYRNLEYLKRQLIWEYLGLSEVLGIEFPRKSFLWWFFLSTPNLCPNKILKTHNYVFDWRPSLGQFGYKRFHFYYKSTFLEIVVKIYMS